MFLDAETFLRTDQRAFGDAWRYELVRGAIVVHPLPCVQHGVIVANLVVEVGNHLHERRDWRVAAGVGAVSQYEDRHTVRIPDAMILCGWLPRVLFDVVPPCESANQHERDQRRADLQAVEGVQEIVEIYQDEMLVHVYRRDASGWMFAWVGGAEAVLPLPSVGVTPRTGCTV